MRANAGQQLRHLQPGVQACLTRRSTVIPKGVLVYILTDNGLTQAEKDTANQMAAAGGTGPAIS